MGIETKDALAVKQLKVKSIAGADASTPMVVGPEATASTQGLVSAADLLVSGKLEVDGAAFFDTSITMAGNLTMATNTRINSGLALGGIEMGNTGQTVSCPFLYTGTTPNFWVIAEYADRTFDFAHAQQTNPTLFIHSANQATDEWISFTHDQTDAFITCGTGDLKLQGASGVDFSGASKTGTGDVACDGYVTLKVAGAAVKFMTTA
jgi:hypothetical protein